MTWRLDLRVNKRRTGQSVLIDGFPFVCDWCGLRFFSARELVAHVCERREAS